MNITEDIIGYEKLRQMEQFARRGCEGRPYFVDGSAEAGRFRVHTGSSDSILLICERVGIEIDLNVYSQVADPPTYKGKYRATEGGLQNFKDPAVLISPKDAINEAFASFETRLRVS